MMPTFDPKTERRRCARLPYPESRIQARYDRIYGHHTKQHVWLIVLAFVPTLAMLGYQAMKYFFF